MNEMCENFMDKDILTDEGRDLSLEVGNFIRSKLIDFQKETGNLYNFEATPAESTAFRLALIRRRGIFRRKSWKSSGRRKSG